MKSFIPLLYILISFNIFGQTFSTLTISNTSTSFGCDGSIDGTISIGSINSSNNSEIDLIINPNQSTGAFNLILSINWGDGTTTAHQGSGNYSSIGQFMTLNPTIQHTYANYGNYVITINYTSTNNGPAGSTTFTYAYSCPPTNVYSALSVDCNQDGQNDYAINDTIPITVVSSTGASYNGMFVNNMASFTPALPIGQYNVVIDSSWLADNSFIVSANSFTAFQSNGNGGAYTVSFVFNCINTQECTTTIIQGYNSISSSLSYSTINPNQISSFVWNIYRFDALGNQMGTASFSTQSNAYINNDSTISYVIACLDATFTNGCTLSICDTFSVDNCISGFVYCDVNSNSIFDNNENVISNAAIQIQTGNGTQILYTDINGYYSLSYSSNSPVLLNINSNWLLSSGYSSSSGIITLASQNCDSNSTFNFAINCGANTLPYNCFSGYVFCDSDNNGIYNTGDTPIPFAPVYVGTNQGAINSTAIAYSDSSGFFIYCGQVTNTNYAIASISSSWLTTNGYTGSNLITLTGLNSYTPSPGYFPLNCNTSCSDLWTTITPWIGYYQNTNATIRLNWGNYGPAAPGQYTLTLTYPIGVNPILSSLYPGYTLTGNTISWTLNSSSTFFNLTDYISFSIPGGLINGASHIFSAAITPVAFTDCNSMNNNGNLLQILGNSYDPNDKNAEKQASYSNTTYAVDEIATTINDKLTYTIRFQNTGTAPAQNIYILDTLSSNLEWSSFNLIASSHPLLVNHLGNGVVRFEFDSIWLVDSSISQELSQGYLIYEITEKSNCLTGCAIENTAYIYFDWNDPIVTNTTLNINVELSSLNDAENYPLIIYPNPAKNEIHFVCDDLLNKIELVEITGKIIQSYSNSYFENDILLPSDLESGTYFIKFYSNNKTIIKKIQVIK